MLKGTKPFRVVETRTDNLDSIPDIDSPPEYKACAGGINSVEIDGKSGENNEFLPEYPFFEILNNDI